MQQIRKHGFKGFTGQVLGCDDGHMTPLEQYRKMLNDERAHFDKILDIINQSKKN